MLLLEDLQEEIDDTIGYMLDEYSSEEDGYVDPSHLYTILVSFYKDGLEAEGHKDVRESVREAAMYLSEDVPIRNIEQLGDVFENFYLTGFHNADTLGGY